VVNSYAICGRRNRAVRSRDHFEMSCIAAIAVSISPSHRAALRAAGSQAAGNGGARRRGEVFDWRPGFGDWVRALGRADWLESAGRKAPPITRYSESH